MPQDVSIEDILSASRRLAGQAIRTPIQTSTTLDQRAAAKIFLKCENFQRIGAFKFRGAFNAVSSLSDEQRRNGVIGFSSGNHAQALALSARLLGSRATILMPDDAPSAKVEATAGYGAEIIRYDRLTQDRAALTSRIAAERGSTLIPPYDHPAVIAGQGTATLELFEDVPQVEMLLVPVGGGGLISGSAIATKSLNPNIKVIGVEPASANDTQMSLRKGQRIEIQPPETIADGLRVTAPGQLTFPIVKRLVDDIVTVSEDAIRDAVRFLLLRMKMLVEPSGAVGVAALLSGSVKAASRTEVIISGGNLDRTLLTELLGA